MELRDRLRLTLASEPRRRAAASSRPAPAACGVPPGGLRPVDSALGKLHVAEQIWPLDYRHGRLRLAAALDLDERALSRLVPGCSGEDLAGAAFVDIETTGLAGGTGTYAFLIGVGTFEQDSFRLRQFFLSDLPEERAMLDSVGEILAAARMVVTFNGRGFDLPLLETRLALNRIARSIRPNDLDLLQPARRLFRHRLDSCRLASLEKGPLGVRRRSDLPGWAVPDAYFQYLRRGQLDALSMVFRHNELDVLSLVTLLACLGELLGRETPSDPDVCLAIARWDAARGRIREATELFELVLRCGLDTPARSAASRQLIRLYRRQRSWSDLERVAGHLRNGARLEDRLYALVEMAKVQEHRRRNYAAAADLTQEALSTLQVMSLTTGSPAAAPWRESLGHRLQRLRKRLRGVRRLSGHRPRVSA